MQMKMPSDHVDYWQDYKGIQYNWALFESWDTRAREVFGNQTLKNSYVLDLQPIHLRTDAHPGSCPGALNHQLEKYHATDRWKIDCLHMCMPGPLDLVPRLFFHMLSLLEKGGG